jgi:phosphoribosylamine---glycine ligase
VVAETVAEAEAAARAMLGAGGGAPGGIVVEERLLGEEASFFALCDGTRAIPLGTAQDHKRAFDGDRGPNTGGMGAVSPAPALTPELQARVIAEIVGPTLRAMRERGTPFVGVLYAGLMLTEGGPKLIEYNVRLGDPEAQALLPRLKTDLVAAMLAACDGGLDGFDIRWRDEAALTVVLATEGYPGAFARGSEVRGVEAAEALPGVLVFQAGTREADGRLLADGGRVLGVTGTGRSIAEARERAYAGVDRIDWPEGFWRRDIGLRALARETAG